MIRLELAGPHTRILSTLCAACPQGTIGCCISPPEYDWSDVGRVVALGGRDWLLGEIAAGNLVKGACGLTIRRARRRSSNTEPRRNKCVYHGPAGCTIEHRQRSATCNYFVCDDVFRDGGEGRGEPEARASRAAHAALRAQYERWDRELAERVGALFPDGPAWDAGFLDWLAEEFSRLSSASSATLRPLAP